MDQKTWTANLAQLKTALHSVMKLANEMAQAAIITFQQDGNLNYCTELANALPKNFGRQAAFINWLTDHAPVLASYNKETETYSFKKDKSEKAQVFRVEEAYKISFWDYSPDETQVKAFTSSDVDKRLLGVIKSFKDETKFAPMNENAKRHLAELEAAIMEKAA